MSADVTPAILNYISHSTYPDSEAVASADLSTDGLLQLLGELKKAQNEAKTSIRSLSKESAPDVDSWIERAKGLQADILRSRDTARQIVAEAEAGNELKAEVEDIAKKVGLLESEVSFNETLVGTLEHIRYANGLLERTQEEAVQGNVEKALQRFEDAEASIGGLEALQGSGAVELLKQRATQLHENLVEAATEHWNAMITVKYDRRSLRITQKAPDRGVPDIGLDSIVLAVKGLSVFDPLVQKLGRDIEKAILWPRMELDENDSIGKIQVSQDELVCVRATNDEGLSSLFKDLDKILEFLATRLPTSINVALSETLIPALTTRLEERWLDPAIPLNISETKSFTSIITDMSALADQIDSYGWYGAERLKDWIRNVPRSWLTKRREAVLGDVRNAVFAGLRERKVVERVETQIVRPGDHATAAVNSADSDNEWDTAWDDPDQDLSAPSGSDQKAPSAPQTDHHEDEDATAWDVDDDTQDKDETGGGDDEVDAWGWGDEDNTKPPSPVAAKKTPTRSAAATKANGDTASRPAEHEMTLRETFTVTAIPDGTLEILQQIISDAEMFSEPEFTSSPLAPAAQALYTLPTLALAIYRATASTAYSKLDVGNMFIYNDSLRLADQLRAWQASRPAESRLRLDNDVVALDTFAKSAYSSEMESQRTILRDLLDGAQGFSNCTVQPYKGECDNAIAGIVDRLRDVHNLWHEVLSQGALLQSLGSLLSTVTGKIISEIEDLGDISEAESKQLKELCDKVMTNKDLFTQTSASGEQQNMTFVFSPTWLKFQYLAEILDSNLADIKWMWKEGELSLEFDAEEVVELVQALFAESDLRKQAIRDIRLGSR